LAPSGWQVPGFVRLRLLEVPYSNPCATAG